MSAASPRRRRTRRRRVLRALGVFILLVVLAIGIGLAVVLPRLSARPGWWTPGLQSDAQAAQLAEEAEKGMTRVLSKDREPGQSWTIELTEDQANAWLATRLERWARSQRADWPEVIRGVRLSFDENSVTIGVAADLASATRFASVTIEPSSADGAVGLRLTGARIGVQAVPLSALRAALADRIPPGTLPPALGEAIETGESHLPEFISLDAGRRVRITSVVVRPSRLLITCTSPAD